MTSLDLIIALDISLMLDNWTKFHYIDLVIGSHWPSLPTQKFVRKNFE